MKGRAGLFPARPFAVAAPPSDYAARRDRITTGFG